MNKKQVFFFYYRKTQISLLFTQLGKYAWSEDFEGGWLLSALQSVFPSSTDTDLLSLLTRVCGEVAKREAYIPDNERAHRSKSAACVYHKLSKDIYFPKSNKKD